MATASEIIEALGGSASVSRETGFPLTTIESWKAANFIPEWRQSALLAIAERASARLGAGDFPPKCARVARAPTPTERTGRAA